MDWLITFILISYAAGWPVTEPAKPLVRLPATADCMEIRQMISQDLNGMGWGESFNLECHEVEEDL